MVVDLFLDEQPRARGANLALVEEDAEERAGHRPRQVRVGEHDVGRLAAQLEADPLQVAFG